MRGRSLLLSHNNKETCWAGIVGHPVWLSSVATASASATTLTVPPNLIFDVKSSFAPKVSKSLPQRQRKQRVGVPVLDNDDKTEPMETSSRDTTVDEEDEDDGTIMDANIYDALQTNKDLRPVIPLPDRLQATVHYGMDGSISGTLSLEESVFGVDPVRIDLIKQAVDYIRAKIRGKRKNITKTVSQVRGSGRKVRQQKGTGQARAGHSRPAHWRGGAKAHGPKGSIQDYGKIKMTKKMRQLAMASVLSQKLKEGNLVLVDQLCLESHKTQPWANLLERSFGIGRLGTSALIVDHYHSPTAEGEGDGDKTAESADPLHSSYNGVPINLWVASANIPKVKVVNPSFVNVYEILKREKLVMTLEALKVFESRLKR
jgi:large subunit ribosomal protein L4